MPLCPSCGALFTEKTNDDGWYAILATLSDQVPTEEHCLDWIESKGISDADAEQTATAMLASLRYDKKLGVWKRGKTEYVQIWATFRSWCLRGLRQNGRVPGTSMKVKEGYY